MFVVFVIFIVYGIGCQKCLGVVRNNRENEKYVGRVSEYVYGEHACGVSEYV